MPAQTTAKRKKDQPANKSVTLSFSRRLSEFTQKHPVQFTIMTLGLGLLWYAGKSLWNLGSWICKTCTAKPAVNRPVAAKAKTKAKTSTRVINSIPPLSTASQNVVEDEGDAVFKKKVKSIIANVSDCAWQDDTLKLLFDSEKHTAAFYQKFSHEDKLFSVYNCISAMGESYAERQRERCTISIANRSARTIDQLLLKITEKAYLDRAKIAIPGITSYSMNQFANELFGGYATLTIQFANPIDKQIFVMEYGNHSAVQKTFLRTDPNLWVVTLKNETSLEELVKTMEENSLKKQADVLNVSHSNNNNINSVNPSRMR